MLVSKFVFLFLCAKISKAELNLFKFLYKIRGSAFESNKI